MKRKISVKRILLFLGFLIILAGIAFATFMLLKPGKKSDSKQNEPKPVKPEPPKEKVDIIDVESKTRPLVVSINNTPVAVKVQTGLNKAYIVYEIPTEGSTSRLLALYKDVDNTKVGTIRSARHNMIDYTYDSDGILTAFGWSFYAQNEMQSGIVNYVQGIVGEGKMYRNNPEHLASEHTAYTSINRIKDFAYNTKKYNKEGENTVLLNYNVKDTDLSSNEGVIDATEITIPYGNIVTKFKYNPETKMYTKIVNGVEIKDHNTKESITTKNIIIEKITYGMTSSNYYWDLHTTGSGSGYYITNGKAVPIKWSKSSRKAKTKYTYNDGKEIEVSDGRTYIQVTVRNYTIK